MIVDNFFRDIYLGSLRSVKGASRRLVNMFREIIAHYILVGNYNHRKKRK